ncbi:hypothetical protein QR680_003077 [Steinernema hermaphroditum]|nr:hypothetical protein QR680_003077 [Steinernema hermaphroditum]
MFRFDSICKNCYAKDHQLEQCPLLEKDDDPMPLPKPKPNPPTPSPEQKEARPASRRLDPRLAKRSQNQGNRPVTPDEQRHNFSDLLKYAPNTPEDELEKLTGLMVRLDDPLHEEGSPSTPPRRGPHTPPGSPPKMEEWELDMDQVWRRCCFPKKLVGTPCKNHLFIDLDKEIKVPPENELSARSSVQDVPADLALHDAVDNTVNGIELNADLEEGELVENDSPQESGTAPTARRSPRSPLEERRRNSYHRHSRRHSRNRSPTPNDPRRRVRPNSSGRSRSHRRHNRRSPSSSRSRSRSYYRSRSRSPHRLSHRSDHRRTSRSPHRSRRIDRRHDPYDNRRSSYDREDRGSRHSSSHRSIGSERSRGLRDDRRFSESSRHRAAPHDKRPSHHRSNDNRSYRSSSESDYRTPSCNTPTAPAPNLAIPNISQQIGQIAGSALLDPNAIMSVAIALSRMQQQQHQPQNPNEAYDDRDNGRYSRSGFRESRRDHGYEDRRDRPPSRFLHQTYQRDEHRDAHDRRNNYKKYD